MRYRSPWRAGEEELEVEARGLVWDRDRWYLAASSARAPAARLWRADRVLSLEPGPSMHPVAGDFDVADLLDRRWLGKAMEAWRREAPARIAMSPAQAVLLKKDWYYGRALFEEEGGRVVMDLRRELGRRGLAPRALARARGRDPRAEGMAGDGSGEVPGPSRGPRGLSSLSPAAPSRGSPSEITGTLSRTDS